MVGDHTYGYIRLLTFSVRYARNPAYMLAEREERIDIEHGIYTLYYARQTLQPHTCIDILLVKLRIIVMPVIVKLCKYVIPDLHITVAVTPYGTIRLTAAVLGASVIVNFRTGAAWAGAMLPEVVFLSKTKDPIRRNPDLLIPDLKSLFIV